jgi:hypothetical protein
MPRLPATAASFWDPTTAPNSSQAGQPSRVNLFDNHSIAVFDDHDLPNHDDGLLLLLNGGNQLTR